MVAVVRYSSVLLANGWRLDDVQEIRDTRVPWARFDRTYAANGSANRKVRSRGNVLSTFRKHLKAKQIRLLQRNENSSKWLPRSKTQELLDRINKSFPRRNSINYRMKELTCYVPSEREREEPATSISNNIDDFLEVTTLYMQILFNDVLISVGMLDKRNRFCTAAAGGTALQLLQ
jgi:nitrogen fixation protein